MIGYVEIENIRREKFTRGAVLRTLKIIARFVPKPYFLGVTALFNINFFQLGYFILKSILSVTGLSKTVYLYCFIKN